MKKKDSNNIATVSSSKLSLIDLTVPITANAVMKSNNDFKISEIEK